MLAPFADKAYHIDDPIYLWTAQQIHTRPLDFYGFDVVWTDDVQPMHEANNNPPGVPYLLAATALLFGWGEIPQHLAIAILAGVLSAGVCGLARHLRVSAPIAVGIATLTPAFLVSANTVMVDVPMLAFYVWAVLFWMVGLERNNHWLLAAAAACMTVSFLCKYFGITTVLLLAMYAIVREKRVRWHLAHLLVPAAALILYEWITHGLYGRSLFVEAASYSSNAGPEIGEALGLRPGEQTLIGLMFAGGSIISTLFWAPLLWKRYLLGIGVGCAIVGIFALYWHTELLSHWTEGNEILNEPSGRVLYAAHGALFALAGLHLLALSALDWARNRDAEACLLGAWLLGTFIFATYINHIVNVRVVLPMVIPSALLVARRLAACHGDIKPSWKTVAPLTAGAAVAMSVLWADFRTANVTRAAATKFIRDNESSINYYYESHWGLQYYLDRASMPYMLEKFESQLRAGDRIVTHRWGSVQVDYDSNLARVVPQLGYREIPCRWLTTMHPLRGAGFYSHTLGPLPYVFAPALPVEYDVYQLGIYGPR